MHMGCPCYGLCRNGKQYSHRCVRLNFIDPDPTPPILQQTNLMCRLFQAHSYMDASAPVYEG
jgi:hypothetical protein